MSVPSEKKEKDILKLLPHPAKPPKLTARRIGIHTSTAGGVANAAERAYRLVVAEGIPFREAYRRVAAELAGK